MSEDKSVWEREKFPVLDVQVDSILRGFTRGRKPKYSFRKPFCWTPKEKFSWGGKTFVWGYKCIAFETENFGNVIQQDPHGLIIGRF